MPEDVSQAQILDSLIRQRLSELHKSLLCKVESYDATACAADVTPVTRNLVTVDPETGEPEFEAFPTLPAVPVSWPGGGAYGMHFDLVPGDVVLVAFLDVDIGGWRSTGATTNDPRDLRRHSVGYPVAFPRVRADTNPNPHAGAWVGHVGTDERVVFEGGFVKLGASAADFVALAAKVDSAIATLVNFANSHTHPVATAGTATAQTGTAAATTSPIAPAPASVAATKVKVQ